MLSLIEELGLLILDVGTAAGRWLRIAIVLILSWPLFLLLCSMFAGDFISWLTCGIFAPETITWLPLIALLPVLLILAGLMLVHPIVITILTASWFSHRSRRVLRFLGYLLGYELIASLYLSAVPLANDRELVPILILFLVTSCFFRTKIKIWKFLMLQVVVLTIIFFLGGRTEAKAKVTDLENRITGPSANPAVGVTPVFSYNPQNRYCDGHKYYDPDYDFQKYDPDVIVIVLQDGCNGDRRILPEVWAGNFTMQMSQNPGDYISVSCTEHGTQTRAFPAYGSLQGLFENCTIPQRREPDGTVIPSGLSADFSPQGRGVLTLTRGSRRTLPPPKSLFDQ